MLRLLVGAETYRRALDLWFARHDGQACTVEDWLRVFEDAERLLRLVTRLTETHEAGRTSPWAVTDAPAEFIRAQLKGIVGFELPITRLEGKWKQIGPPSDGI